MKNGPQFYFAILTMALSLSFFTSCSDENPGIQPESGTVVKTRAESESGALTSKQFIVNEALVKKLAMRIDNEGRFFIPNQSKQERGIASIHKIDDEGGLPVLYIVNYTENGFAVFSGDIRFTPLCAYIEQGLYEKIAVPSGLVDWFDATATLIQSIRNGTSLPEPDVFKNWEEALASTGQEPLIANSNCCPICPNYPDCLKDSSIGCGEPDIICPPGGDGSGDGSSSGSDDVDPCGPIATTTRGPLLTTTWGQQCTYNENCPLLGCNACYSNTRALTGCVATAISQVLRYWEHPNQYLYQYYTMPDDHGDREVQRMMRDVGNSVSMNYGCTSSGATGSSIPRSFKNTFAFGNASRKSYQPADHVTIMQNINQEMPVVLDGCQTINKVFGFFTTFDKCHAWVCDGYQINRNKCINNLKLHMNWGWDGYYNGWFHYQTWSGAGTGFPYSQNMTYNIAP
jgi:hypothetical protein